MAEHRHPQWWSTQQTSTWERVKEALARDWEQTKADFSNEYGKDLDQDAVDTVVAKTRVLLTTAGPLKLYGDPFV